MSATPSTNPLIAIACGGTGGHLFPGLAVAGELISRRCDVVLLISPKEVDQQGVKNARWMKIVTLPAVALERGSVFAFTRGFWKSYRLAKETFRARPPQGVLAMGGFTSAPPILAGRSFGAVTFFHESNMIPGRANRWLAHVVAEAFVGFPRAADRLFMPKVTTTGTPVRSEFEPMDAAACRRAMGLIPERPVMLVMGGSQGANGVNELIIHALPHLIRAHPELQFIHLTGARDHDRVYTIYNAHRVKAVVRPFLSEMEYALGAATLSVSRAGASSLAELAAMRLPSILIPYPSAADNHQFFNARAFVESGAARMLEQRTATADDLIRVTGELLENAELRRTMGGALSRFHFPNAAAHIADHMLAVIRLRQPKAMATEAAPKPAPSERALNSQAIRSTPAPLK